MNYDEALKLATEKHKGQKRRDGRDYISHPIAVASKFEDESYKTVAILHDTIEDTDLTLEDLRLRGLDENLIFAVDILTRKQHQTYLEYVLETKKYKITREIKIEDLKHNLSDKPTSIDKYLLALHILLN